ncbi:AAA family ATPase [Candidatus Woesearchaeota archaeon]|nr:AAA family ATPase [Candidatus Woesearchaeota archaeon]
MGVFNEILRSDQTLIKNDDALSYEFLPKLLPFRETEQKYLATCIKPLFNNRSGRNLLIHGPPGIGKTAATKHVLRDLEEETDEIEVIFINCWQKNTTYKVLLEICDVIGYRFTQNKKTTELFKVISSIINKKSAVFVFDEIDKAEELDFLYYVLEEIHRKAVFLITNYKTWMLELDERIKSRLVPELLEFKQYNLEETKQILKERLTYAFYDGAWKEENIKPIYDKAYEVKDIRTGLFLLRESALIAEEESSKEIKKEHVQKALRKIDDFTIKNKDLLEEETQLIYELVKQKSGSKIGDLYNTYKERGGNSSYKTFQRKINKLEEAKFISTKKQTGSGGNTTIVEKKITDF